MYCTHCGTEVGAEHKFCPSCGKTLGPAPTTAAPSTPVGRLQQHLPLLAILWLAYSALKVLGAFGLFLAGHVILPGIVGMGAHRMPHFVPTLLSGIGWMLIVLAAAGIAAGWGLWQREAWARPLALILGFLALLNIPFGTALGVYTLVILLPAEAGAEYDRMAGKL